jgi:pantothenate kinase type III
MILTIDIGNTNQTYFLTKFNEEILQGDLENLNSDLQANQIKVSEISTFVSSVKDPKLAKINIPNTIVRDFHKDSQFLEMPVHYTNTIGDDRLISAYYFYKTSPERKLIIDSGSFTTIDLVDKAGFHGGFILPGWDKIKTSYIQGENLAPPTLTSTTSKIFNIPHNTIDAISQGALISFLAPIKAAIASISPDKIFISGGNHKIIFDFLNSEKLSIPVISVNNTVHLGLQLLGKEKQL